MSEAFRYISYELLRKESFQANQKMKGKIPCVAGKAECCTADVPLVKQDIDRIHKAVQREKFSEDEIKEVVANASNSQTQSCPFLDENSMCRLYGDTIENDFRPLMCVEFGYGGLPVSKDEFARLHQKQEDLGFDPGISARELRPDSSFGACNSCREEMIEKDINIPLNCLSAANNAATFVGFNKIKNIKTFVQEDYTI